MRFGEQLARWRDLAAIKQAELERSIGKSRGYLTRVESGAFAPPKSVTDAIAEALRAAGLDISNEEVWSAAAPEAADPDVRAYYEEQLASQRAAVEQLRQEGRTRHLGSLWRVIGMMQTCLDASASERQAGAKGPDLTRILERYLQAVLVMASSDGPPSPESPPQYSARVGLALEGLLPLLDAPSRLPPAMGVHTLRTAADTNASLLAAWEQTIKGAPRWSATWAGSEPLDDLPAEPAPEPAKATPRSKSKSE